MTMFNWSMIQMKKTMKSISVSSDGTVAPLLVIKAKSNPNIRESNCTTQRYQLKKEVPHICSLLLYVAVYL